MLTCFDMYIDMIRKHLIIIIARSLSDVLTMQISEHLQAVVVYYSFTYVSIRLHNIYQRLYDTHTIEYQTITPSHLFLYIFRIKHKKRPNGYPFDLFKL